jgi:hypothetical protein
VGLVGGLERRRQVPHHALEALGPVEVGVEVDVELQLGAMVLVMRVEVCVGGRVQVWQRRPPGWEERACTEGVEVTGGGGRK